MDIVKPSDNTLAESQHRFVFISYARRDARDLAVRLRDDLLMEGYRVWLDTAEIEGGASWSNEIEQAIEACDITLALLSNASFISEICRAEQLRALRKNKTVIPLLVQPNAERPLHLEHLNYRDFTDAVSYPQSFDLLKRDLLTNETIPLPEIRRQTIVSTPPLPPHFIHREEELAFLRRTVIGDDTDQQIALTALRGMGGIGKSVLATALCHDEVIQAAFPDGVIWVTIGKEPGNLTEQMKFIGTKLGDSPGYYTSEVAGSDRLRTLLAHKAVLLVLDDVWDANHIQPFRLEAPRCRTLFTTRDGGIALSVGASEVRLGTLNKEQSLELLREWAGRDDVKLADIADKLGNLPLALKLAGARLREGMTGKEWLETFQHVSQIKLGRRSTSPNENLEICFDLSVQQLMSEDQLLYHAIGVFAEDVSIPQKTITKLWRQIDSGLNEYDANELVIDLARLALVDRNQDDETITLHDLLHDYTRTKLGNRLAQTHEEMLQAYNPQNKAWWDVPHDGYLYYQLGYHLIGAGQRDLFFSLLVNSPDWMEAKFNACMGDNAYVGDLDLAMRQFKDPLSARDAEIVAQIYIIRQIVTIRASVYTDDDLSTLVWIGRKAEAVNHARLRIDQEAKFKGLYEIYKATAESDTPDSAIRDEMLRTLRGLENKHIIQQHLKNCWQLLHTYHDNLHVVVFEEWLTYIYPPSDIADMVRLYDIANTLEGHNINIASRLHTVILDLAHNETPDGHYKSPFSDSEDEWSKLADDMLKAGFFDEAIALASVIPNSDILKNIAMWLCLKHHPRHALLATDKFASIQKKKAQETDKLLDNPSAQDIYAQLAYEFAKQGLSDECLTAIQKGDLSKQEKLIFAVCVQFIKQDQHELALKLFQTVNIGASSLEIKLLNTETPTNFVILAGMVGHLTRKNRLSDAVSVINTIVMQTEHVLAGEELYHHTVTILAETKPIDEVLTIIENTRFGTAPNEPFLIITDAPAEGLLRLSHITSPADLWDDMPADMPPKPIVNTAKQPKSPKLRGKTRLYVSLAKGLFERGEMSLGMGVIKHIPPLERDDALYAIALADIKDDSDPFDLSSTKKIGEIGLHIYSYINDIMLRRSIQVNLITTFYETHEPIITEIEQHIVADALPHLHLYPKLLRDCLLIVVKNQRHSAVMHYIQSHPDQLDMGIEILLDGADYLVKKGQPINDLLTMAEALVRQEPIQPSPQEKYIPTTDDPFDDPVFLTMDFDDPSFPDLHPDMLHPKADFLSRIAKLTYAIDKNRSQALFEEALAYQKEAFEIIIFPYIEAGHISALYRLEAWCAEQPDSSPPTFYIRKKLDMRRFITPEAFLQVMDFINQTKNDILREYILKHLDAAL